MTIDRYSKDTGGLSGKTENVGATERWMRINHIMATLRGHLDEVVRRRKVLKYIDCGERRMSDVENNVAMLTNCLQEWVPGLWNPEQPLVNIATGGKAEANMIENIKTIKKEARTQWMSLLQG